MAKSDLLAIIFISLTSIAALLELRRLKGVVSRCAITSSDVMVSFLIPARNEGASISNLLASISNLLEATSLRYEVIVVDDGSTDDTVEKASLFNFVKLVEVTEPPLVGTNGKSNALSIAAGRALGEVLVFLDADVEVGSGIIGCIGAIAEGGEVKLLSLQPYHRARGVGEGFALTFNVVSLFSALVSNLASRRPKLAFGPVLITRREDYRNVGGHEKILYEVVDDVALSRSYFEHGLKVVTLLDRSVATFRMYPLGFVQMIEGFTKNFVVGASSLSPLAAVIGFGYVFGFLGLEISVARDFVQHRIIFGLILYAVCSGLLAFGSRLVGRFSPLVQFLHPLAFCLFVLVFVRALGRRVLSLPNTWKGRVV